MPRTGTDTDIDAMIDGDQLVQVNVRFPKRRADIARRLAEKNQMTLSAYLENLVVRDMVNEQDALRASYEEQVERARAARAQLDAELASTGRSLRVTR